MLANINTPVSALRAPDAAALDDNSDEESFLRIHDLSKFTSVPVNRPADLPPAMATLDELNAHLLLLSEHPSKSTPTMILQ